MKSQYNKTITACFVGYIVQAIVNNFTPLLFLFFQKCYHIPISKITLLVTFNFGIQLLVDLLSVRFVDKIGYRISMIIAHVLAAAGLFLPTVFFYVVGIDNWKILAIIWAVIPIGNAFVFSKVPIAPLLEDGDTGLGLKELFRMKIFWILLIMMICAGASEQAVSQWASAFAEKGLGISKAAGDLAGPMAFAVLMGISRLFYGKYGDRINLEHFMIYSSFLCILSYLGISLFSIPLLNLIACAVCGLSVGIMWPGTFSKASAALPKGGTAMFALLALGGDIGCSGGPTLVGMVSGAFGDNLKMGILAGIIFPVLLLIGVILCRRQKKITNYNTVKSRH